MGSEEKNSQTDRPAQKEQKIHKTPSFLSLNTKSITNLIKNIFNPKKQSIKPVKNNFTVTTIPISEILSNDENFEIKIKNEIKTIKLGTDQNIQTDETSQNTYQCKTSQKIEKITTDKKFYINKSNNRDILEEKYFEKRSSKEKNVILESFPEEKNFHHFSEKISTDYNRNNSKESEKPLSKLQRNKSEDYFHDKTRQNKQISQNITKNGETNSNQIKGDKNYSLQKNKIRNYNNNLNNQSNKISSFDKMAQNNREITPENTRENARKDNRDLRFNNSNLLEERTEINNQARLNPVIESNSDARLLNNGTIYNYSRDIDLEGNLDNFKAENTKINSFGCKHYKRKCLIEYKCCDRLYECRMCHNKTEDHKCDRKEIKEITCLICLTKQPFGHSCVNCNVFFAEYICYECKLLTDDTKTFHCKDCGVCRKGEKSHFFHCKHCNACLPIYIKEFHENYQMKNLDGSKPDLPRINTHVENTLKSICPICAQDLFFSTSHVVLMNCGHSIHKKCFISYKNKSFQCPICLKSSSSSKTVNERIDYVLEQCQDLNNQKNINLYECVTACFDCQAECKTKYTYLYNKCCNCGSYNTKINELYKREE